MGTGTTATGHPDQQRRHQHDESGNGAGDADVEQDRFATGKASRIWMTAPSVPVSGIGAGMNYGSDASTL